MVRHFYIQTAMAFIFVLVINSTLSAQPISQEHVHVYVQSDTLRLDATIDSLFSRRNIDAIGSGMTASILVQFRLITDRGDNLAQRNLIKRLEHDIWEEQYRLIGQTTAPDTLLTSKFEDVRRA